MTPLALSISGEIKSLGAYAGFAAVVGLAAARPALLRPGPRAAPAHRVGGPRPRAQRSDRTAAASCHAGQAPRRARSAPGRTSARSGRPVRRCRDRAPHRTRPRRAPASRHHRRPDSAPRRRNPAPRWSRRSPDSGRAAQRRLSRRRPARPRPKSARPHRPLPASLRPPERSAVRARRRLPPAVGRTGIDPDHLSAARGAPPTGPGGPARASPGLSSSTGPPSPSRHVAAPPVPARRPAGAAESQGSPPPGGLPTSTLAPSRGRTLGVVAGAFVVLVLLVFGATRLLGGGGAGNPSTTPATSATAPGGGSTPTSSTASTADGPAVERHRRRAQRPERHPGTGGQGRDPAAQRRIRDGQGDDAVTDERSRAATTSSVEYATAADKPAAKQVAKALGLTSSAVAPLDAATAANPAISGRPGRRVGSWQRLQQ